MYYTESSFYELCTATNKIIESTSCRSFSPILKAESRGTSRRIPMYRCSSPGCRWNGRWWSRDALTRFPPSNRSNISCRAHAKANLRLGLPGKARRSPPGNCWKWNGKRSKKSLAQGRFPCPLFGAVTVSGPRRLNFGRAAQTGFTTGSNTAVKPTIRGKSNGLRHKESRRFFRKMPLLSCSPPQNWI